MEGAAMVTSRSVLWLAGLVLMVAGSAAADERPALVPTKDVDISYKVTRPNQPAIIERRRWLAGEHLERVDGPDKSTTIFDRHKGEFILLNVGNKTFRKLEGKGRQPPEPEAGITLTRGGEAVIAGLHCVEWTWSQDTETHT